MRYIIGIMLLAAGLFFACISQKTGNEGAFEGDFYEGAAMGYRGMIHVRVGMENGTITEITVIEAQEDRAVGWAAIEELTDLVLMYNTTEIDAISGATETSMGFLEAVENAIMGP
jgi:uncharacterized protein with FMN-binding domain